MDDYTRAILLFLFEFINVDNFPREKDEIRTRLENRVKECGAKNFEGAIDFIIEALFPPEDGTGSRRPC